MTPAFAAWVERAKAVSLGTILRTRKIELKGRGDKLTGACPKCLGDDRFAVHLGKGDGVFNCRGCNGSGGGAISFVRFLDDCTFLQAVEKITGEPPPVEDRSERKRRDDRVPLGPIVETYDYTDETGARLYQVTRHDPKNFRQRQPDPGNPDGWISNIDGVRLVPYHLPDLVEAVACGQPVFVVEGEKDANTAERLGLIATCNVMGAGKWKVRGADYAQHFRGADVVIIPDNDLDPRKGRRHANDIAKDLHDVAERVRVLLLPAGKDLTEWIEEHGGSREALDALTESAPEYMNGYDPSGDGGAPQAPQPQEQYTREFRLIPCAEFVAGFIPPRYLIDGILQRKFIYSLTGLTGHAKTAVALLMAEQVASHDRNAMLGSNRVNKGRVVYFAGENPDDVRARVKGNFENYDVALSFVEGVFNLKEIMARAHQAANALQGVDLVIIDTSAAYFLGDDEINNTQMGAHARLLRSLTDLFGGPCVLVLCHPIKHATEPEQLLPRGGGAFLNEMDGNLTLFKVDEDTVELSYTKMRGPGFQPIRFEIETVRTTRVLDAEGRVMPTVRARALTRTEEEQQDMAYTADREALLVAMLKNRDASYAALADFLQWQTDSGAPNKQKVERTLKYIEANAKPTLIRRNFKKPYLTQEGEAAAIKIDGRMQGLRNYRSQGGLFDDK